MAELRRRLKANSALALDTPLDALRDATSPAVKELNPGLGQALNASQDGSQTLYDYIRIHAPDLYPLFMREYPFDRFRVDLAVPSALLAIEVNGGRWQPGGGKHGTERDRHKIRRLTIAGWRVLEYSTELVNNDPIGVIAEIREALCKS